MALAADLLAGGHAAWGQAAGSAPPVKVETRSIPGRDVKQVNAQGIIDTSCGR